MSIISRLIGAGDMLLYHDYRSGSFRDFSGNNNHGTPTGVSLGRSGVKCLSSSDLITVSDNAGLRVTSVTLAFVFGNTIENHTARKELIAKRDGGGTNYDIQINQGGTANKIVWYDGGASRVINATFAGSRGIILACNNGEVADCYVNGLFAANSTTAITVASDDADLIIGNLYSGNYTFDQVPIAAVVILDRKVTATEAAELHTELINKKWNQKTISIASRQSLDFWADKLDGYDEILTGGSYTAGQTIPGTSIKVAAGSFTIGSETIDGETSKYIECTNSSGRFYIDLTNDPVYQTAYGTWKFHFNKAASSNARVLFAVATTDDYNGAGQLGYLTSLNSTEQIWLQRTFAPSIAHLFNTDVNVVNDGSYDEYRITRDRSGRFHYYLNDTLVTPIGGTPGTNPVTENTTKLCNYSVFVLGLGDRVGLKTISNRPLLSLDPLSKVTLSTLGNGALETVSNVTSGPLPGTPFEVESGTFKTTYDTINGKPVKVIESVADDSRIRSPLSAFQNNENEAAYGIYEFWLNKATGSVFKTGLFFTEIGPYNATGQDGYVYQVTSVEYVEFYRIVAAGYLLLAKSNTGEATESVWEKHTIKRTSSNLFSLYINDELVTITSGTPGTNPLTESTNTSGKYWHFEMDTGDKIAIAGFDGTPLLLKRKGVA